MDILRKTWAYFKPYKKQITIIFLAGLIVTALSMVNPYITRLIFDRVFYGGEHDLLMPLLAIMILQTVIRHVISYFRTYQLEKYSYKANVEMRDDAFKKFLSLTHDFFNKEKTGHLMTLLSSDVEVVRGLITGTIPTTVEMLISFVFASVMLFSMNVWLTLGCYLILPLTFILTRKYSKEIRKEHTAIREQTAQLSTVAQENINGVRVVRAFAREDYESQKFDRENDKFRATYLSMRKVWGKNYWKLSLAGNYPYLLLLMAGGILTAQGKMTVGMFVAFGGYINYLINPINTISGYISSIQNAMASGEKLFNFLVREPDIQNPANAYAPDVFRGHISFRKVNLRYEDNNALEGIDIEIEPGKKLGIMGETGSGKTSILNLMGRYYDRTSGEILVDGVDIKKYDLGMLRKNIAFVIQDTFLFSDSIESNIAFGKPEADFDAVKESAQTARADSFIQKMPEGYDTVIGERGIGLSGGQKQRISIARAVLTGAPIVILDDSTSSLDMETEHEIQENFSESLKGRTQVIVASRISAVRDADEIIYMKDGKIAERGTHEELLKQGGMYTEIYKEQYGSLGEVT